MTKKVGRPRKHEVDAVSCLTRIPRALMGMLDQEGVSRQDSILAAIERGIAVCNHAHVTQVQREQERIKQELREAQSRILSLARQCLDAGLEPQFLRQTDEIIERLGQIELDLESNP
jgi:hypothetical protein